MTDVLSQIHDSLAKLDEQERLELLAKLGLGKPSPRPETPTPGLPHTPLQPTRTTHIRSEIEWV